MLSYSRKVRHVANTDTGTFSSLAHLTFSVYKLFFVNLPSIDEEAETPNYKFGGYLAATWGSNMILDGQREFK